MSSFEFKDTTIVLQNELTIENAEAFLKFVSANLSSIKQNTSLTIDAKDLESIDSAGVAAIDQVIDNLKKSSIKADIIKYVIEPVCGDYIDNDITIHVNPTGAFIMGGPQADAGLTGRKIIVDTYGGMGRHGGGAFSGKDPSKVDRSAAYCARYIAKNIVAAELAKECEVQLAYAIGVAEPVSVFVNTFGTGKIPDDKLMEIVRAVFSLTPNGIIKHLKLRRPIYRLTSAYGHFGRDLDEFTWEKTDKVDILKKKAEKIK